MDLNKIMYFDFDYRLEKSLRNKMSELNIAIISWQNGHGATMLEIDVSDYATCRALLDLEVIYQEDYDNLVKNKVDAVFLY